MIVAVMRGPEKMWNVIFSIFSWKATKFYFNFSQFLEQILVNKAYPVMQADNNLIKLLHV